MTRSELQDHQIHVSTNARTEILETDSHYPYICFAFRFMSRGK